MATIDYKEKYEQALERARQFSEKPYLEDSAGIVEYIFPELKESEDERIRKELIAMVKWSCTNGDDVDKMITWLEKQGEHANFCSKIQVGDKVTRNEDGVLVNLSQLKRVAKKDEKQGEQKPSQEIVPFEAEHGKYYYCIKDYFCGGRKQASKGDVVQALRGLPIMGLKDASEYFLPVNFIKCDAAWSEEDESVISLILSICNDFLESFEISPASLKVIKEDVDKIDNWLKSLRPQNWKPSDEQINALNYVVNLMASSERPTENDLYYNILKSLRQQLKKLKG